MIDNIPPGSITMSDWNILVIEYQGQLIEKFLGYSHEDRHFRLSSQIIEYDPEANTGKTVSGSRYFFHDKPGNLHPLAQSYFDRISNRDEVSVHLKFEGGVSNA